MTDVQVLPIKMHSGKLSFKQNCNLLIYIYIKNFSTLLYMVHSLKHIGW